MEESSPVEHDPARDRTAERPAGEQFAVASAPSWLWRRADQSAVSGLVALALLAMAAWWWRLGGLHGELIRFEDAPHTTVTFKVDVNSADWPELAQLPGIGERTARRIVEWRRTHGPFQRQADLLQIDGIGQVTLDGFREYLTDLPP